MFPASLTCKLLSPKCEVLGDSLEESLLTNNFVMDIVKASVGTSDVQLDAC
jgi:hypothetical protein